MISKQMRDWGANGNSIREIAAYGERRAAEIGAENVYNFSIGSPSIEPPDCVHAAVEHLLHTVPPTQLHAYAPAPGMASVREKVAAYLTQTFGEAYRAQDIYMTDGASSALAILTRALLCPGDEAIVFAPYFPEYAVYAEAAGGSVRVVPCKADTFALDLEALSAAVTEKTALLILNSPNNPSGVVISRPELAALSAMLREKQARYGHPIYIIADEPYRELVYGGVEVPFLPTLYPNAIYCYSYSKTLSLPGECGLSRPAPGDGRLRRRARRRARRGARIGVHLRVVAVPACRGGVPRKDGRHCGLCRKPRADLWRAHGYGLSLRAAGRRVLPLPQVARAGFARVLPPRDGL